MPNSYVTALQNLFDEYKGVVDREGEELHIVDMLKKEMIDRAITSKL